MSKAKHAHGPWEVFDSGLIFVKKEIAIPADGGEEKEGER